MTPTLTAQETFQSPTNPSHSIQYTHLNRGAPHTLLFCYGAGGQSIDINLYQHFISTHPSLSLLCVDRWTQPFTSTSTSPTSTTSNDKPPTTTGPALLSELTRITIALLGTLKIHTFSIAAHSAGAYQMLHLAQTCISTATNPNLNLKNIFPICTHIPTPFTASKSLRAMCTMPTPLFTAITTLDASLGSSPIARLFLHAHAHAVRSKNRADADTFVDTPELRALLVRERERDAQERKSSDRARAQRRSLDYRLVYCRIPGIGDEVLSKLYTELGLGNGSGSGVRLSWFTCEGDVFFGPGSVRRVVGGMRGGEEVEVVGVEGASHADVYFRREVWEGMYRRILEE